MLLKVFKNEWRLMAREKTLWFAALLLLAFAIYAIQNGINWQSQRQTTIANYVLEAEKALDEQRAAVEEQEQNPDANNGRPAGGQPNRASYEATLPPGPLSALTIGQSDLYPFRASVSPFRRQDNLFRNYQIDSPLGLLAGKFDFTFVIVYLLPLLIIALGYNLLSGEKESGVLALALSQPLSASKLVFGKVLARLALLTGLVIVVGILGGMFGVAGSDVALPLDRLVFWLAIIGVYATFWFALTALVAAFGRKSEMNLTVLMSAWLLFLLVVPALLNISINQISPVPSRMEYVSKMRAAENDAQRKSSELLAEFYHEHPELAAGEQRRDFVSTFYAVQQDVESSVLPVAQEYERRLMDQQALIGTFRLLSPAVVVQEALNDIAGSSVARQQSYVRQLREYLLEWRSFLAPKIFRSERLASRDYEALPRFEFQEEETSVISARVMPGAAGLLVLTGVLLFWATAKLKRFRLVS